MNHSILLLIITFAISISSVNVQAADAQHALDHANVDLNNKSALQRGAKLYVNYCMGCHSLKYQRFSRTAKDFGLTEKEMREHLIFTTDKHGNKSEIGAMMTNTMDVEYAESVFGVVPPDLSLVARSRGKDWLYTYLHSFYYDPERPLGANNTLMPNVGMPHVLAPLQGWQMPVYSEMVNAAGDTVDIISDFELLPGGSMTAQEYDKAVLDLVSFLDYVGEPAKLVRARIGAYVLLFLFVFGVLTYALKKEYWRDIH